MHFLPRLGTALCRTKPSIPNHPHPAQGSTHAAHRSTFAAVDNPTPGGASPERYGAAVHELLGAGAEPGEVDPGPRYRVPRHRYGGRPWVLANMVASADGASTLDGRSGQLGGPVDKQVFRLLRSVADVVLVGAGTVRAERYRPIAEPRPVPIAVVTRSLDLDWESPLFRGPPATTVVVTCRSAPAERRAQASELAEVVVAGEDAVEPVRALAALAERGHRVVLCEGGPALLAQVVAAGLLDELCLTVSPMLVGGNGPRILDGAHADGPSALTLASVLEHEGTLFLRYLAAP